MSRGIFSPEELAELEAFDREIEDDDEPLTLEEWRESMRRDRGLEGPPKPCSDERRAQQRESSRIYRETHREQVREAHRRWYRKNREYAQAWQRDYYRRHTSEHREAGLHFRALYPEAGKELRTLRMSLGLTQGAVGAMFGCCRSAVSFWERGKVSVPRRVLEWMEAHSTGKVEEWGNRA